MGKMQIKAENKFSLKNLTATLVAGLFILLIYSNCSSASIFKDQKDNLFFASQGVIKKTSNLVENWITYELPTTWEVNLMENADGQIYAAWMEGPQLYLSATNKIGNPVALLKFEKAPDYWDLKIRNGRLHLIYALSGYLYYQNSDNLGRSFSPARILNENLPLSLNPQMESLNIVFASDGKVYLLTSTDNGNNFALPYEIYSSKNQIDQLVFISNNICFTERESENKYNLFICASSPPGKANPILSSLNPILDLKAITNDYHHTVVYYNERNLLKYMVTGPNILGLSKIITNAPPPNSNFEGLIQIKDTLYSIWDKNHEIQMLPIANRSPSAPSLTNLKSNLNTSIVHFKARSSDADQDPIYYRAEISWDENFAPSKTWAFENLSPEAEIVSPLPDGKYYIKFYALDGLSQSPPSAVQIFSLDREPPQISLGPVQPATNQALQEIKGVLSEKAALSINQELVGLSGGLSFSKSLPLSPGENRLVLCATDEAGNSTSEVISINYNRDAPLISITKPKATDWFKKEGTVFIEAAISDNQNDIEDEKEAEMSIDNILLSQTLLYDKGAQSLSGFVPLPSDLSHGNHLIIATLSDQNGNLGTATFSLNIDDHPPQIKDKNLSIFKDKIIIPFQEEGSGLDLSSSLIIIRQASKEVAGKTQKQGDNLIFIPNQPLLEADYEITITPRDLVGNLGDKKAVKLKLDSVNALSSGSDTAAEVKFQKFAYGPNPFIIGKDPRLVINFDLTRAAETKLYIFTLLGDLILSKNLGSVSSGPYIWDGKNAYGEIVAAGVYPCTLVASDSSGKKEIVRGKIIVLKD